MRTRYSLCLSALRALDVIKKFIRVGDYVLKNYICKNSFEIP